MNISLIDAPIPERENNPVGWPNVVREFVASGSDSALVEIDGAEQTSDFSTLNRAYVGLGEAIKRQKVAVRVVQRSGRIYLKRTE